jgi:hypothetical protein
MYLDRHLKAHHFTQVDQLGVRLCWAILHDRVLGEDTLRGVTRAVSTAVTSSVRRKRIGTML